MSQTDVAKEIHAHAVILYLGVPAALAAVVAGAGAAAKGILDIANHGADGIDLGDILDSGRVEAYNIAWYLGVA